MYNSTQKQQMKVIILTGESFPNGMAATNRIKCYARAIKEGGIECEVVIFRRTEPYGSKPRNTIGQGLFEGIPFRYISGTPLRGSNILIRQLNDRVDQLRTDRFLRRVLMKGDILFFYMGGYVHLILRYMKTAHAKGAFCIRDLCELPFCTEAETKRTIRLRKVTIEKQFPRLDGIISISDALLNFAKSNTLPTCKHVKVPIMVEYEHYYICKKVSDKEIPYIFHAGTLYQQKDGILGIIEAFGMAKQRLQMPIKYILTSSIDASPHANEIRRLINKYQLEDSVEFVGYLVREQIKDYLSKASLVISNRPKSEQDYYGFSTKIGEYLASGTPLITTNWGEAVNWLKDGESAYIIEPEDTNALADTIVQAFSNPDEALKIGRTGQELCQHSFDYRVWSKPLVDFLQHLGD